MAEASLPAWHQALVYALTGDRRAELGHQAQPDLAVVVGHLRDRLATDEVGVAARSRHRLPPDLAAGLGAAQFEAALTALRARLAESAAAPPARVGPDRTLTADEQRLLREVPPHHGG